MTVLSVRTGDWMQTYSGKMFWPLDPRIEELDHLDIAMALGNICRFGGHTLEFYSVAQHSVLVSRIVEAEGGTKEQALYGLIHDASEAYLGDIIRPLKHTSVFSSYRRTEFALQALITHFYGLRWPCDAQTEALVKKADDRALMTEGRDIMAPPPQAWGFPGGIVPFGDPDEDRIISQPPKMASLSYLGRATELSNAF